MARGLRPAAPGAAPQQLAWSSDNARAAHGRPTALQPDCARSAGSSGCWPRFHPRTPAGRRIRPPAVAAIAFFCSSTSGRDCSAACSAFFTPPTQPGLTTGPCWNRRGARARPTPPAWSPAAARAVLAGGACGRRSEGFASAAVGLRIHRATALKVLARTPHGGYAVAEAGGDVAGAL